MTEWRELPYAPEKTTDDYKRARIHGKPVPFV